MSVTVTPQVERRIQDWIERGGFPDADAVIDQALQALEKEEQAKHLRLRELVRAGFESGPGVELTEELWDELERRSEERFLRGDEPAPQVCP